MPERFSEFSLKESVYLLLKDPVFPDFLHTGLCNKTCVYSQTGGEVGADVVGADVGAAETKLNLAKRKLRWKG